VGVAGSVLASAWCALAGSAGELIAARAVQGSAAAVVIPRTIGLIRCMFSGAELPKALGTIGPVMGLTSMCGPPLGGLLIHADLFGWSWRTIFLVNVALGIGVWLAARLWPEDRAASPPRLELAGTALVALGLGLLVYPLLGGGHWWLLVVGPAVLGLFVVTQRRAARTGRPVLVEPSLFAGPGFSAALAGSVLFFGVTTGLVLVVVLQMQLGGCAIGRSRPAAMDRWHGTCFLAGRCPSGPEVRPVGDVRRTGHAASRPVGRDRWLPGPARRAAGGAAA
jgi:MFS family permease